MNRGDTQPTPPGTTMAPSFDLKRPTPSQCLHSRDKYNPWSNVGLTVICALCLLERCSLCHKSMSGTDYSKHHDSNCPNR